MMASVKEKNEICTIHLQMFESKIIKNTGNIHLHMLTCTHTQRRQLEANVDLYNKNDYTIAKKDD